MSRGFYILLFFGLIIGNVTVYRSVFAPHVLEVKVLNVGEKGSATLVRTPSGATILIDTGPNASILRALGSSLPMWQRRIDAIVLTGTKSSLVGGLPSVESRYRVSTIVKIGDKDIPYGTLLAFDNSYIEIIAPATFIISYSSTSFKISSTTPAGTYISDEEIITAP